MPSERVQRRIDALLDAADRVVAESNGALVVEQCHNRAEWSMAMRRAVTAQYYGPWLASGMGEGSNRLRVP